MLTYQGMRMSGGQQIDANTVALDLFARIDAKLDTLTAGLNQQMIRLARLEERDQTEAVKGLGRAVETLARKVERLQDHTVTIATLEKDLAAIRADQMQVQAFDKGKRHVVNEGMRWTAFFAEHGWKIVALVALAYGFLAKGADLLAPRIEQPIPLQQGYPQGYNVRPAPAVYTPAGRADAGALAHLRGREA